MVSDALRNVPPASLDPQRRMSRAPKESHRGSPPPNLPRFRGRNTIGVTSNFSPEIEVNEAKGAT